MNIVPLNLSWNWLKDKFWKFTDSYDAWMNRHEYEDQKLSDRHPFTVQQFSEEFSAILAKQIVKIAVRIRLDEKL